MSINRTRWLDKLRPAGASSGGWTEGPMAPVETTDAATVDQRCPFKHRTGWRHNHQTQNCVSPCAWVKLIFSVSRIVIFAQGHALFTLNFPGNSICACHPSVLHREKKRPDLCVSSLCKPYLCIVQKKKPSQILNVILVQGTCSNIQMDDHDANTQVMMFIVLVAGHAKTAQNFQDLSHPASARRNIPRGDGSVRT